MDDQSRHSIIRERGGCWLMYVLVHESSVLLYGYG